MISLTKKEFKAALTEAAKWEQQLTEKERTKISFSDARKAVIERIFEKYTNEKEREYLGF